MSTKHCKEQLIKQYPKTKASQWKRRSKETNEEGFVSRRFEYAGPVTAIVNTRELGNGVETHEVLLELGVEASKKPKKQPTGKSRFLFAVFESEMAVHGLEILIGTRRYWEEEGCLNDYYEDADFKVLEPILDKLGLDELSESIYECRSKTGLDELRGALLSNGLEEDAGFTTFLREL